MAVSTTSLLLVISISCPMLAAPNHQGVTFLAADAFITADPDKEANFSCRSTLDLRSGFQGFHWTLEGEPIQVVRSRIWEQQQLQTVTTVVRGTWHDKQLECTLIAGGQPFKDSSRIRVRGQLRSFTRKGFRIMSWSPDATQPEQSSVVAPGKSISLTCTSNLDWDVCRWKRPASEQPCGILSDMPSAKVCGEAWHGLNAQWTVRKVSPTQCTITGYSVQPEDQGEWHCNLESKALHIAGQEHSTYDSDQKYFYLALLKPAQLVRDHFPPVTEALDGEAVHLSASSFNAWPQPRIDCKVINSSSHVNVLYQADSLQVTYVFNHHDDGKQLECQASQSDSHSNQVLSSLTTNLKLKINPVAPDPQTQSLDASIIALIVACGAFVLLGLVFLLLAYRTGRMCFKDKPPAMGTCIQVQTDQKCDTGVDMSVGTERTENECLLGSDAQPLHQESHITAAVQLCDTLNPEDETRLFDYEGRGSSAGSLSTLDGNELTDGDSEDSENSEMD